MNWTSFTFERDGPIGHVWLNRPERRNALNQTALEEITALFTELQRDFDLRVVILGGRGKSFCAGADLKDPPGIAEMGDRSGTTIRERRWFSDLGTRAYQAIEQLDAITIARIHGHAVGGGALLAFACDLRVAAVGTQFAIPELGLGDVLNWRGVPRLVGEVGIARAREIVFLGERIDAVDAERYGLINRVVPMEQLDEVAGDWAARISQKPETAVMLSKAQFRSYAMMQSVGDTGQFEPAFELEAMQDEATRQRFGAA